jgi:two-component system alkaline phosphatase synthesis response regulator PhoP
MKLTIDKERYSIIVNMKEIILPRKQFEILWLLCSVPGKVFSRHAIFEKIWGKESTSDERTVDVHLANLRKTVGSEFFHTIKGIGFKVLIEKVEIKKSVDSI